jgi:hypothetical protein
VAKKEIFPEKIQDYINCSHAARKRRRPDSGGRQPGFERRQHRSLSAAKKLWRKLKKE